MKMGLFCNTKDGTPVLFNVRPILFMRLFDLNVQLTVGKIERNFNERIHEANYKI